MMDKDKLNEIIESHGKWLRTEEGGVRADLCEADLRGANLCRADLRRADLRGADLCEADLRGADLPSKIIQVGPIGSRQSYTIYRVDEDIVQCGCWNNYKGGSLDEFKQRIDTVYPDGTYRQEYLAAIAMFEKMKESKDEFSTKDGTEKRCAEC